MDRVSDHNVLQCVEHVALGPYYYTIVASGYMYYVIFFKFCVSVYIFFKQH